MPLSSALKKRILNDFTSLPRLFEALDTLDMTISLLCCLTKTEDNSNKSLSDFLTNTLRIPNPELGQQVKYEQDQTFSLYIVIFQWLLQYSSRKFYAKVGHDLLKIVSLISKKCR